MWSDAQLLAETARDPAAFGAWYRRHEREVLAWLFGIARHVLARSVERGRVENRQIR